MRRSAPAPVRVTLGGGAPSSPLRSPSPTDIAAIDRHADDGSDRDDGSDDGNDADGGDEGDDTGVDLDADVIDAHGRVLNDGDELLDAPPPASSSAELTAAAATSHAALQGTGELLQSAFPSLNADGSQRIWLCPSAYGRPAVVYFDYPLAFGMQRAQEKIACPRVCHLRFKHADDACIYNSITGPKPAAAQFIAACCHEHPPVADSPTRRLFLCVRS